MNSEVLQFRLLKKDYIVPNIPKEYEYQIVDLNSFEKQKERLLNVAKQMSLEMEWAGIPNTEEKLLKRFKNNSFCQFWTWNKKDIGWTWFNFNVSHNWESIDQLLKPNECFVGGAFVSRKINRPAISSFIFYNFAFSYLLSINGKDTVYLCSDKWNRASHILCFKSGFKLYNFIKDDY